MLSSDLKKFTNKEVINFIPPKYHNSKTEPYVSFYARDPLSGKLKRKKYMVGRFRKGKERNFMVAQIIANIYNKVSNGWNPWVKSNKTRGYTPIGEVLSLYSVHLEKSYRKKLLKHKTYIDYSSRLKRVREYIESRVLTIVYAQDIDVFWCNEFLDYILYDRDDSARTRNNYRTWLSTFCAWMVKKAYIDINPVEQVSTIKESEKERQPLSPDDMNKLARYLRRENEFFYLACLMEYYTFIRPVELVQLRLRDISIKEQKIFISADVSKNKKDANVALNDKILKLMIRLNIFRYPGNCYIFGKDFRPSDERADSRIFRDEFAKVRTALNFPDHYKFYSLKDSGIRDLMNDEKSGVIIARDQARHSSVAVTNLYAQGKNTPVHDEAKHFKGKL